MQSIIRVGGLAVLLAASVAQAQTPAPAVRTEKNISLALANQIAAETVAACAARNGYNVAATVVDRAGVVRAGADNAGPHTLASSERKAWTSASAKSPTQAMMEGAQKNPAPRTLLHLLGSLDAGRRRAACRSSRATK